MYRLSLEAGSAPTDWGGRSGRVLTHIEDGSLLRSLLGLLPGDIILSANGAPLPDSPVEGRALYERLKMEETFRVELVRDGQISAVEYRYR